ncbi:xyloglucan endotransglucosylase protein 7-like [Primulina tabacum]|uniref:xyloglucan endotransglucosylase protein 7-like n=1 Tax=Primulina tabacum TaxID=48773 RepID=UPI003F59D39A
MPPRNFPYPSHSKKSLPYLVFIIFFAIFIFKVDIVILQYAIRSKVRSTSSQTIVTRNGTFHRHFVATWGINHVQILEDGELLTLSLDNVSGSGFESKKEFLFGKIDMRIKLVPGNAAGTVSTYYLISEGEQPDKIDIEFMGNSTGNPYTLHTNIFVHGKGEREQQFFLWFDPTLDFHTYSILWNPKCIILYVDGVPIREFKNLEGLGVPFPTRPMRLYSSLWNAEDWATQGGSVKTDWNLAPFVTSYSNFSADACIWSHQTRRSSCNPADFSSKTWLNMELDGRSRARMERTRKGYMIYDFCRDKWRFLNGTGPECQIN